MSETFNITIDGREIECRPGDKVLAKALENGIYIPHYCYHPGLTIAGNCRMCLVKSNKAPKPVIACATDCVPDLVIDASSEEVQKLQRLVMEFLLINHPLDCPVCDQAGECRLQDYAHEYGRAQGRFREAKNVKPSTVVGPEVALWKQRCIACSRCIRFCDEVSGTGELRFLQRGDRVEIETFPGVPLDNPLSGNVVDLCPVGALVSRDFLYEARVWNLKRQSSICPGCSRGCNVHVDVLDTKWDEPEVKRLVPRENQEVNGWWMCDFGRHEKDSLHTKKVGGEERQRLGTILERERPAASSGEASPGEPVLREVRDLEEVMAALAGAAERHRGRVAIIGNLWQTVEEMHLVSRLATALQAKVGLLEREPGEEMVFPGFHISEDRNPNRAGAQLVFGDEVVDGGLAAVTGAIDRGEIDLAIVFNTMTGWDAPADLREKIGAVAEKLVVTLFEDELAARADWILPGASWAETDGTIVNENGRLQRLAGAFRSPGRALSDLEYLQAMLRALGGFEHEGVSAAGIFQMAAGEVGALAGVRYPGRGSHGVQVAGDAGGNA